MTNRVAQAGKSRTVRDVTGVPTAVDELANTTAVGRGRRKAAASKTTSNGAKAQKALDETSDQTAAAKGGRAKKTQIVTKAMEAVLGTHQGMSNPSAEVMPELPGSLTNKPPRKRGPTAKPKDPDDPNDPANPPKPGRKPRTKKTKPENEPANTTEDQQPAPPKKTRGLRAKKTDDHPEGNGGLQPSSSALTDTFGSSLNPPTSEANTTETTEAKPQPKTTRQTRATANITQTDLTTTLPRNRRTPVPKAPIRSSTRKRGNAATATKEPTPNPPPGKKRKVETSEGQVMAQTTSAADGTAVASVEKEIGKDAEGGQGNGEEEVQAKQVEKSGPGKRKRMRT